MTTDATNPAGSGKESAEPVAAVRLDYGQEIPRWRRFWVDAWAWVRERIENGWESISYFAGALAYLAGGWRQLAMALGSAWLAGGLGLVLDRGDGSGPFWMWIGGFLVGLVIPVSPIRRGK